MQAAFVLPLPIPLLRKPPLTTRRRPRYYASRPPRFPPRAVHDGTPDVFHSHPQPAESIDAYLRCVECSAIYVVEPEELEGAPRVVGCSACLHEWYASEADLLWGEDEALKAVEQHSSFEVRSGRAKDALEKDITKEAEQLGSADGDLDQPLATSGKNNGHVDAKGNELETGRSKEKPMEVDIDNTMSESSNSTSEESGEIDRFSIFVGNLSFRATEEDLFRAFSGYGSVLKCQVPADASGASKGYGFVEMSTRKAGLKAIDELQGTSIFGRDVSLHEARPKREFVSSKRQGSTGAKKDSRKRAAALLNEHGTVRAKAPKEREKDRARSRPSKELAS